MNQNKKLEKKADDKDAEIIKERAPTPKMMQTVIKVHTNKKISILFSTDFLLSRKAQKPDVACVVVL